MIIKKFNEEKIQHPESIGFGKIEETPEKFSGSLQSLESRITQLEAKIQELIEDIDELYFLQKSKKLK